MKITSSYPTTITMDDPDTGQPQTIRLRIARMTLEQANRFLREYYRAAHPSSEAVLARLPGEDGLEAGAVRARRLSDMTDSGRAAFEAREAAEAEFAAEFLAATIRDYVRVEPDQIFEEAADGTDRSITSGADLVRLFGARMDVMQACLKAVHTENTLSAAAKKALRSLSDSARISAARLSAQPGTTLAPTVDGAGIAASAMPEDAPAPAPTLSSGSSSDSETGGK